MRRHIGAGMWLGLFLALTAPAVPGARAQEGAPDARLLRGPATANEGDRLTLDTPEGAVEIRLHGIDAPDPGQTCRTRRNQDYDCFAVARQVLQQMVEGREVQCRVTYTDRLGQRLGTCAVGGVDLAAAMVLRGWAFAYRALSGDYVRLEAQAQARRFGLWAGRAEAPWLWRTRQLAEPRS